MWLRVCCGDGGLDGIRFSATAANACAACTVLLVGGKMCAAVCECSRVAVGVCVCGQVAWFVVNWVMCASSSAR